VKIANSSRGGVSLELAKRELDVLQHLLAMYPCLPADHFRDSGSTRKPPTDASQELLEDALADHRAEKRKLVENWLADPTRTRKHASLWQIDFSAEELECLLQLLNDVRVGSWVRLGCPEGNLGNLARENGVHLWAMEMAGYFQMQILSEAEAGPRQ
jgi:hypothetical protein